jgi:hypothetical protein
MYGSRDLVRVLNDLVGQRGNEATKQRGNEAMRQ